MEQLFSGGHHKFEFLDLINKYSVMFDFTSPILKFGLVVVAVLIIFLARINARGEFPVLILMNRWLRWLLFAVFFAYLLKVFEFSSRSDWVHFVTGFMLWFLIETAYNWLAIKVLSRSEIPLFPRFKVNKDGDEWPKIAHLDKIKNWLNKISKRSLVSLFGPFTLELVLELVLELISILSSR